MTAQAVQINQNEILQRIDALADTLGVAANHVWEVLVAQATIHGWLTLGVMALVGIPIMSAWATSLFLRLSGKTKWTVEHKVDVPTNHGVIFMIATIALAIYGIVSIFVVPRIATQIANPEYWAFKELSGLF